MIVHVFGAKFRSPFGLLCSIVTLSGYSHAAIEIEGKIYDTTFSRGKFAQSFDKNLFKGRSVLSFHCNDIDNEKVKKFVSKHYNRKYDTKGLLMWPTGINDPKKWYCFEAVMECLRHCDKSIKAKNRYSALDIINYCKSKDYYMTWQRE